MPHVAVSGVMVAVCPGLRLLQITPAVELGPKLKVDGSALVGELVRIMCRSLGGAGVELNPRAAYLPACFDPGGQACSISHVAA